MKVELKKKKSELQYSSSLIMAWQYQINGKIMTAVTFVGIFIKLYHTNLFFRQDILYLSGGIFFSVWRTSVKYKKLSLMLDILTHSTFIVTYISSDLLYFSSFIIAVFKPSLWKRPLSYSLYPMNSLEYARSVSLGSEMNRISSFSFFSFLLHWNNYHK